MCALGRVCRFFGFQPPFSALRDVNLSSQSAETLVCTLEMPSGGARPSMALFPSEADGSGRSVGYTGPGRVWKRKSARAMPPWLPLDECGVLWSTPRMNRGNSETERETENDTSRHSPMAGVCQWLSINLLYRHGTGICLFPLMRPPVWGTRVP